MTRTRTGSLLQIFGGRPRDAVAGQKPPPEPPTALATIESPPDPLADVLNMLDGVGCLTRNLTTLASTMRAHHDQPFEQLADRAGRVGELHQRLEAICSEVGALQIDMAQHGTEEHAHA